MRGHRVDRFILEMSPLPDMLSLAEDAQKGEEISNRMEKGGF